MIDFVGETLSQLREQQQWRECTPFVGLDFQSNDYLGLSRNPVVKNSVVRELEQSQLIGSTGSALLSGYQEEHQKFEYQLEQLYGGHKKVLTFTSGYMANLATLSALGPHVHYYSDQRNHSSLIDGIRLSGSAYSVFRHNDLNHLEDLVKAQKDSRRKVIVLESIYSMRGDCAPIEEIKKIADEYQALCVVDESHATGVYGSNYTGLAADFPENWISIHPCGKGLGLFGAYVICSKQLKEYFVNSSRGFIFTTAVPAWWVGSWVSVFQIIQSQTEFSTRLLKNCEVFRRHLATLSAPQMESHIYYWQLGDNGRALAASEELKQANIVLKPIRYPTVPKGEEGLRIVVHSHNSTQEIQKLFDVLKNMGFYGSKK